MHIDIANRFKPFSHEAGTCCVLPFSTLQCEIYPALIKISDISNGFPKVIEEIQFDFKGPVKDFTVELDLEKGFIKVWGHALQGFFRYRIEAASGKFRIVFEKNPENCLCSQVSSGQSALIFPAVEYLSFGVSKAQDWPMIKRRNSLMEILPFWFRLGQLIPPMAQHNQGTASLLQNIEKALQEKNKEMLEQSFNTLFLTGFQGMLSPTLHDTQYQGFDIPKLPENCQESPMLLLTAGTALIKRMLINYSNNIVEILPCLLSELHCGRLLNASLETYGLINLEWSKKTIRRMIFKACIDQEIKFKFDRDLKTFRLRSLANPRGAIKKCDEPIMITNGEEYLFDNFKR